MRTYRSSVPARFMTMTNTRWWITGTVPSGRFPIRSTAPVQQPVYRQVPRFATKYYYNIWRWTPSRDVTATGTDHNAEWPVPELAENEREGQRSERYLFTVEHTKEKRSPETYMLAESDWMNINVDDHLFITSKRTGADPYISDEKGNKIADIRLVR